MSTPTRSYQTIVAAASLVLGPLLMSFGDLLHPKEDAGAGDQIAIIVDHASRWYTAHLLLFIGLLLFIPGILALADLTAERSPRAGYAARSLVLIGVGVFSAVFMLEMLVGRYILDGASETEATELLETIQSGWIFGVALLAGLAFFAGVAAFTIPLIAGGGTFRWPAVAFAVGTVLILGEIISAQVLLSQIGNVVLFLGSAAFAWRILRRDEPTAAS